MTTIDLIRSRREEALKVAQRQGVTSVRVFGSVARHEESGDSNIVTESGLNPLFRDQVLADAVAL